MANNQLLMVDGSDGFIGSHLVSYLLKREDASVRAVDVSFSGL
jgi:nucleoside-diphosphate-sugar epimerase